jgi:3-methyladenine DNA glycosylase AlkD
MPSSFQSAVRKALTAQADPLVKENYQRYFKNAVTLIGVRSPEIKIVFREVFPLLAQCTPEQCVEQAFLLLGSEYLEEKQIGVSVLSRIEKKLTEQFVRRVEPVFDRSVTDWATCDALSGRVLRYILRRDDAARKRVVGWSKADYLWRQRASAVAFVNEARHGNYNGDIVYICRNIVNNQERFVQLGMGWVLRELSLADQKLALVFLAAHYPKISREGLRYAIEKMPAALQKRILAEHAEACSAKGGVHSVKGRKPVRPSVRGGS